MIRIPNKLKSIGKRNVELVSDSSPVIDTNKNLNAKLTQGTLYINLSTILNKLRQLKFLQNASGLMQISLKNFSGQSINMTIPSVDMNKFYDLTSFNYNFFVSFNQTFPPQTSSSLFSNISVIIKNDIPVSSSNIASIDINDYGTFRLLTCLLFSFKYGIVLDSLCSCYPKTPSELNAVSSGIGLNCVNLECKNTLLANPEKFDNLIHTDCSNIGIQAAFVSISAFTGGNFNIKNMNITNTFDCIKKNSEEAVSQK